MGKRVIAKKKQQLKSQVEQSEWVLPDPVEQLDVEIPNWSRENATLASILQSGMLEISTGPSQTRFYVHKDVLLKAGSLIRYVSNNDLGVPIKLPQVNPDVFKLVLVYLYRSFDQRYKPEKYLKLVRGYEATTQLDRACQLYCFAKKYDIYELERDTREHIQSLNTDDYESILRVAKLVYPTAWAMEPWFHDYFVAHTKRALVDMQITTLPWFLDALIGNYSNLGATIFEVLRDMYVSLSEPLTPASESFTRDSFNCSPCSRTSVNSRRSSVIDEQVKEPTVEDLIPQAEFLVHRTIGKAGPKPTDEILESTKSVEKKLWNWSMNEAKTRQRDSKTQRTSGPSGWASCGESTTASTEMLLEDEPPMETAMAEDAEEDIVGNAKSEMPLESDATAEESDKKEPQTQPEPWDFGLNAKEKKKRKKEMQSQGIRFDCWGQPMYTQSEPLPLEAKPAEEVVGAHEVEWLPESAPDEPRASLSKLESEEESFSVTMALEIHHRNCPNRFLRCEAIKDWASFTTAILGCMPYCAAAESDGSALWLSDVRVKFDDDYFWIKNDVESTLLHVLKDASAKSTVVRIIMVVYDNLHYPSEQDVCIAPGTLVDQPQTGGW